MQRSNSNSPKLYCRDNFEPTVKTTKTINIEASIHHLLKVQAVNEGVQLGEYAEVLLMVGMTHQQEVKQLLGSRTKPVGPLEPE